MAGRTLGKETLGWDHEIDRPITRGYVYFAREMPDGPIKIGFSGWSIRSRIKGLQIGNPRELKVIGLVEGSTASEAEWHRRFSDDHIRGEWFDASPDLMRAIVSETIDLTDAEIL